MLPFRAATCCSSRGWCSSSPEDCLCDDCIYYEWEEAQALLPPEMPLDDENSDFVLILTGYQHYLIQPSVGIRLDIEPFSDLSLQIKCNENKILIVVNTAINNFRYR